MPEDFPRSVRLRRRADFKEAYASGRKLHGETVVVFVRWHTEGAAGSPRFGITVTRRAGGAVVRNRLKRQVRDALRRFPARAALGGADVVVNVRDSARGTPYGALRADLDRLLSRAARSAP